MPSEEHVGPLKGVAVIEVIEDPESATAAPVVQPRKSQMWSAEGVALEWPVKHDTETERKI